MTTVRELEAVINVSGDFERKLDELIDKLIALDAMVSRVDDRNLDLNASPAMRSIAALQSQLTTLQAQSMMGLGSLGRGGGGDGTNIDEMVKRLARDMQKTSKQASEAASAFNITNLRMSDLHNLLARLVPMLVTVIGAVPALVGALVGLAGAALAATAALGGLVGFGALGFAIQESGRGNIGEGFSQMMSEIRESFLDAFIPLAERLAPLMEDALSGLDRLFQAIANRGDVLVQFGNAARDLGGFILETFPDFIATIGRVATAFVPVFEAIARTIGQQNIGAGFIDFMRQVLPPFMDFMKLLGNLIPLILGISIGFLRVTNGIMLFVNALFEALTFLGAFDEVLGILIGSFLVAVTAVSLFNSTLLSATFGGLVKFGTALGGLITGTTSFSAAVTGATGSLISFRAVLASVLAISGIGVLIAAVGLIGNHFLNLGSNVGEATSKLREFQRVSNRVSGQNPYGNAEVPERGAMTGGGFSQVNVTINGRAEEDVIKQEMQNGNFRMNKTGSSIN